MKLKNLLVIPLGISVILFAFFSHEIFDTFMKIVSFFPWSAISLSIVFVALILQLIGHTVRCVKMTFLFRPVRRTSFLTQFRALSIGYLFDALLPFRLGELIRSQIIASRTKMSYSLVLFLIVFERLMDLFFICIIALALFVRNSVSNGVILYLSALLCLMLIFSILLFLLWKPNDHLNSAVYKISSIFNTRIKNRIRFSTWSLNYGLQKVLSCKTVVCFFVMSIGSWLFYGASTWLLSCLLLPNLTVGGHVASALSVFLGPALPLGPAALGTFSKSINLFTTTLSLGANNSLLFNICSWMLITIPMALIGVILLAFFTKEPLWRNMPEHGSSLYVSDKLSRTENISNEMEYFLECYFSNNTLSKVVHQLELSNSIRLIKYFKGGSDAITILALENKKLIVKKIIPEKFEDRLKAQYEWLINHKGPGVVQALKESEGDGFYSIDISYNQDNIAFYDYMHQNPLEESKRIMAEVVGCLYKTVYRNQRTVSDEKRLRAYVDKHVFGCASVAANSHADLAAILTQDQIFINGSEYDNLYTIINKILDDSIILKDLSTYRDSQVVHGDVTVDNILVSSQTGEFLLIDPSPDGNIINGPVFDFGKIMQSLYCGYEFLIRNTEFVELQMNNSIQFADSRSAVYKSLCDYVRFELAPSCLTEGETRAMIFHSGVLLIRRLKHQVYQNPANTLAFYGMGVKTLNDFYRQYKN
jgi:uncharacterized protein (TIRG00374 family)